ncbi:hypothetical protein CIT292_09215 [Citrobacter youngae ATCC 29220]|uniref:Uncharacterized protein n=1 Tax=Citrobacter youngae ATCC 29220 TaxID=500640 RepID=D4BG44_9ENTR|nr:hypothetical protein CIT292_09215 [Citrobacter youngae ATCC 29220]
MQKEHHQVINACLYINSIAISTYQYLPTDRQKGDASGIKITDKQSSRLRCRFPIAHNPSRHHFSLTPQ